MARHAAFRGHLCKPDWFCHLLYSFIWEEVTLTSGPQRWPTSWSFNILLLPHTVSSTHLQVPCAAKSLDEMASMGVKALQKWLGTIASTSFRKTGMCEDLNVWRCKSKLEHRRQPYAENAINDTANWDIQEPLQICSEKASPCPESRIQARKTSPPPGQHYAATLLCLPATQPEASTASQGSMGKEWMVQAEEAAAEPCCDSTSTPLPALLLHWGLCEYKSQLLPTRATASPTACSVVHNWSASSVLTATKDQGDKSWKHITFFIQEKKDFPFLTFHIKTENGTMPRKSSVCKAGGGKGLKSSFLFPIPLEAKWKGKTKQNKNNTKTPSWKTPHFCCCCWETTCLWIKKKCHFGTTFISSFEACKLLNIIW